jgi:hypothetical protein
MEELRAPIYEILIGSRDLDAINEEIDSAIKSCFAGQHLRIRVLGSERHEGKTLDELIDIIADTGTDRYDPAVRSDRYDNREGKRIDFFALDFVVNPHTKILGEFTWRKKLRPPLKIDVVIVYDISQVERVVYTPTGREDNKFDGFAFRDGSKKRDAIKAVFKICFGK